MYTETTRQNPFPLPSALQPFSVPGPKDLMLTFRQVSDSPLAVIACWSSLILAHYRISLESGEDSKIPIAELGKRSLPIHEFRGFLERDGTVLRCLARSLTDSSGRSVNTEQFIRKAFTQARGTGDRTFEVSLVFGDRRLVEAITEELTDPRLTFH